MLRQCSNFKFTVLKQYILDCINNLNGQDIICFKMDNKYIITSEMILCTGKSNSHVISIAQDVLYKLRSISYYFYGVEGLDTGEWVLIDLGDIIIHIMQKETRNLYALEKLWNQYLLHE